MITMKTKLYFSIALLFIGLSACEDILDLSSKSGIPMVDYYKTQDDAIIALNGVYDYLGKIDGYSKHLWGAGIELMNDEMQVKPGKANLIAKEQLSNGTVENSNIILKAIWGNSYAAINAANMLLVKLPEIPMDERLRNRIEAEARFNRALWYFNLVRIWGDVPLKLEPNTTYIQKYDRAPSVEVYAQIIEDFEFGAGVVDGEWVESDEGNGLFWNYKEAMQRGRATKGAAIAYLAKVYQQMAGWPLKSEGAWEKSVEWSKRVIDSGYYTIYGDLDNDGVYADDDYSRIWGYDNEYNSEIIFDVQFITGDVGEGGQVGAFYGIQGSAALGASNTHGNVLKSFTNTWDADANLNNKPETDDNRFEWNVATFKYNTSGKEIPHKNPGTYTLGKFRRPWGATHYWTDIPLNLPLVRYADIVLTYVEGLYETQGLAAVTEINMHLNSIRKRAYGTKWNEATYAADITGMDHDAFIDFLLQERSWELCYEGMRWFDLVRTEKLVDNINASVSVAKDNVKWPLHGKMPIPQYELDINQHWETNGYK